MRTKADVLLHPVRMRIVQALAGGERLPTADLAERLADVPAATLYRHLGALTDAGVLAVVELRPARGTPERTYALVQGAGSLTAQDLARATADDHLRYFTMFCAGLIDDFGRYVTAGPADLVADGVGYRQVPLWLTDTELAELAGRLAAALAPVLGNEPGDGRRRRILSTVLMPSDPTRKETP